MAIRQLIKTFFYQPCDLTQVDSQYFRKDYATVMQTLGEGIYCTKSWLDIYKFWTS